MTTLIRQNRRSLTWLFYAAAAVLIFLWLQPLVAQQATNQVIQRTITGVLLGAIYSTIALGIVVINKASGVFNFAHGGMMMLSGYMFYTFFTSSSITPTAAVLLATATVVLVLTTSSWRDLLRPAYLIGGVIAVAVLTAAMTVGGLDFRWLHALAGAVCGAVLIGLLIERFTIRPLIGQPIFAAVMVTLALAQVLDGLTKLIWGTLPQSLPVFSEPHPFLPDTLVRIQQPIIIPTANTIIGGDVNVDVPRLLAFGLALVAFGLFFVLFRYTNIGLAMRATSEDQQLAEAVGLRVRVILAVTWGIASVLAGAAAVLFVGASDSVTLDTNLQFVALRAFPAVLLGGLESVGGALVGGLVLGLTEEWAKLLFSGDVAENLAPYVVLMIILVLRPEGLFGEKRIERI